MTNHLRKPVLAPGGWGFPPGYILAGYAELPDLDLEHLKGRSRNNAIVEALIPLRQFAALRVVDIQRKYGLPHVSAHAILRRIELG